MTAPTPESKTKRQAARDAWLKARSEGWEKIRAGKTRAERQAARAGIKTAREAWMTARNEYRTGVGKGPVQDTARYKANQVKRQLRQTKRGLRRAVRG
jgi:hypothetical protein